MSEVWWFIQTIVFYFSPPSYRIYSFLLFSAELLNIQFSTFFPPSYRIYSFLLFSAELPNIHDVINRYFPKCFFLSGHFLNVQFHKYVLVAALGPHCSPRRLWPNLSFGKLPLIKLHIWEITTRENAFGKIPNTINIPMKTGYNIFLGNSGTHKSKTLE